MIKKLLGFWFSIPLAILLGLAPGFLAAEWWEHRPSVPSWACVNVLFVHWCPVTPLLAQKNRELADFNALLAREAAATNQALVIQKKQNDITRVAEVDEVKAQEKIRLVTNTIVKEVPTYVTAATDARFPVPWGLVRVHDAAVLGVEPDSLPNPGGAADGSASAVADSDLATTFAHNYGECLADRERLVSLQSWVSSELRENPAP